MTVHGQPSSDKFVTITREQQRQCIIWSKENIVKDSIISSKDSIITLQRDFIQYTDTLIQNYSKRLSEVNLKHEKMKRKRRNSLIFGSIGGFISGIVLMFAIK